MKYLALILVVIGLSVVLTKGNSVEWDYFLFVHEWPQTVCQAAKANEVCRIPGNCTGWSIHGIWPTKLGTEGPNYCNSSATFNWEAIESLDGQLMEYWPNCYVETPYWSFWAHEYLKHGTCCAEIESMATEYDFFSTTLKLSQKYDIYNILKKGHVIPSNNTAYKVTEIIDVIQETTSTKPLLTCYYDHTTKVQWLQQVVLCMHKDFSLMDCPNMIYDPCYADEPVFYPQRHPQTSH